MPNPDAFIQVPISAELDTTAQWFAERRILFEYPGHDRQVFGDYGPAHVRTIKRGILGELTVFQYLHDALQERHGNLSPAARSQRVRDKVCLHTTLGCFDAGYDLTVAGQSLDVKVYATSLVEPARIPTLNLLVNEQEIAGRQPADLYVQVFFTGERHLVLAGYSEGLPPLNPNFPSPAYARRVTDLLPMANLRQLVLRNP